eukprot:TRINITY_DN4163_c0_g1_i2.p1 TRINITY_DN4163_c0_g1~~TRINITY_DN4163_c0_g1_i2.p1  ORF type:complete len:394 (+),score=113.14 TRINITY_DN4163_c0_g1_i2:71-1183(+)
MAGEMRLGEKATDAMAGRIDAAPGQQHASHIECSVCNYPAFENPVKTAVCAHLFHEECLVRWIRNKDGDARSCPLCRQVLPAGDGAYTEADRYLKAIFSAMEVDCPQDCAAPNPKRMRYDKLAEHIRACPMTPLACGNAGCTAVKPQREMQAHGAECDHGLATCALCEQKVRRGAMQVHLGNDCPRRCFKCAFCQKEDLLCCNKEAHERECPGQVPMSWVADLRQQNSDLRKQNEELQAENRELREAQGEQLRKLHDKNQELLQLMHATLYTRIEVTSVENPWYNGEYTITPQQRNGCSIWRSKNDRLVFKNQGGLWMITAGEDSMLSEKAALSSESKSDEPHPISSSWNYFTDAWVAAPGTSVTVMTRA